jgi:threonine dehydratase
MTATLEAYQPPVHTASGDEAFAIIDMYRHEVKDHFTVEALTAEFPSYARRLGGKGAHLAHAEDNLAGAFKWRGAFVGAFELARQGHESLVVPSAGNHARGAILAAKVLDMDIHVVVPRSAPPAKCERLASLWASPKLAVHTVGQSYDESLAWALGNPQSGALLHPYDDPYVTAGQGTLVDDILNVQADVRHIVVPVGGGGLLAGILHRLQEKGRHDVHVHAIEADGSNSLTLSLNEGTSVPAKGPNARYGGSAVRYAGDQAIMEASSYPNLHFYTADEESVDELIDEYQQDRIELLRRATPNLEPTSLVAIAGLEQVVRAYPDDAITVVGTGQNDALRPLRNSHAYRVPV